MIHLQVTTRHFYYFTAVRILLSATVSARTPLQVVYLVLTSENRLVSSWLVPNIATTLKSKVARSLHTFDQHFLVQYVHNNRTNVAVLALFTHATIYRDSRNIEEKLFYDNFNKSLQRFKNDTRYSCTNFYESYEYDLYNRTSKNKVSRLKSRFILNVYGRLLRK